MHATPLGFMSIAVSNANLNQEFINTIPLEASCFKVHQSRNPKPGAEVKSCVLGSFSKSKEAEE